MSTINPFKYTFRTLVEAFKHPPGDQSGFISDDFPWSDEALINEMLSIRATILTASLEANKKVSQQPVQILGCVEIEEADRNECPCALPSGCYWSKTKSVIPKYIKLTAVTGVVANGEMPWFNPVLWPSIKFIPSARNEFQRKGRYWTTRDTGGGRYLYTIGDRDLEKIAITGIFENPMEAAAYPNCGIQDEQALCSPLDTEVYTDSELINQVLQMTWAKLLPARQTAATDIKNNDKPDPVGR